MKTVLVTGANRGIGLAFTKQLSDLGLQVLACCRQPENASELQALATARKNITVYQLDVSNQQHIEHLAEELSDHVIDIVLNNAGVMGENGVTVGNIDRDNFLNVMSVNCLSVLKVSEAFLPHLGKSTDKLIVVISSAMGSISDNQSGRSYAYRASKTAVNSVMRSFAIDVNDKGIKVLLLHPGWVQTNMGGDSALLDADKAVSAMLEQIEKHKHNAQAEVLRRYDGGTMPW